MTITAKEREMVQQLAAEFEREWQPGLLEYWSGGLNAYAPSVQQAILTAWVQVDLRQRWQRNEHVPIDSYLVRYPNLGTHDTCPIGLVAEELFLRRQLGMSEAELLRRFPHRIRELLSAVGPLVPSQALPPFPPQASTRTSPPQLAPVTRAPALPPSVFDGRYEIETEIGSGGMGKVYRALDRKFQRRVALKIPGIGVDEEVLERFQREAQILAQLKHPNLCAVYDVGAHQEMPYLVMEYVEGRALCEWVNPAQPLEQRQTANLVALVAEAMQAAHDKGIIHRDLKPSNIILRPDGQPIVVDFGVARLKNSSLTLPRQLLGTPAYMPREQVENNGQEIGPVSDVYSLGAVLYELLTGRPAYDGPLITILARIVNGPPPPTPRQLRPDVSPTLEAICLKAMAVQPSARYPSMALFAQELRDYLSDGEPTIVTLPAPLMGNRVAPSTRSEAAPGAQPTPMLPPELFALNTRTVETQHQPGIPDLLVTSPTLEAHPVLLAPLGVPVNAALPDATLPPPDLSPAPSMLFPPPQLIDPPRRRSWVLVVAALMLPLFVGASVVGVLALHRYSTRSSEMVQTSGPTESTPPTNLTEQQTAFRVNLPEGWTDLRILVDGQEIPNNEWKTLTRGRHEFQLTGAGIDKYTEPLVFTKSLAEWPTSKNELNALQPFGTVTITLNGYRQQAGPVEMRFDEFPKLTVKRDEEFKVTVGTHTLRLSGPYLPTTTKPVEVVRGRPNAVDVKLDWLSSVRLRGVPTDSSDKITLDTTMSKLSDLGSLKVKSGTRRLQVAGKFVEVDEQVLLLPGENDVTPSKAKFYGYLTVEPSEIDEELIIHVDRDTRTIRTASVDIRVEAGSYRVWITGTHADSTTETIEVKPGETRKHKPKYRYYATRQLKLSPAEAAEKAKVTLDGEEVKNWKDPLRATEGKHKLKINGKGLQESSEDVTFGRNRGPDINVKLQIDSELELDLDGKTKIRLARVPAAKGTVGVGEKEPVGTFDSSNIARQKQVDLKAYWIGTHEVTQGQYKAVMGKDNLPPQPRDNDDLPVVSLTVEQMKKFCDELGTLKGKKIRLPTEYEWEYACRCGGTDPYNFGKDRSSKKIKQDDACFDGKKPYDGESNAEDRRGRTPTGFVAVTDKTYSPNAWGLHHMHGNVAEVCTRSWDDGKNEFDYYLRGGAYNDSGVVCHAAYRRPVQLPSNSRTGFRIVCE